MIKEAPMKGQIIVQGQKYEYTLRRNGRAKRLILKVDPAGDIVVVIPWRVTRQAAEAFVSSRVKWLDEVIKKHLEKPTRPLIELRSGAWLPILGDMKQLLVTVEKDRQRTSFIEEGNTLRVAVPKIGAVKETVVRWYRERANEYVSGQAKSLADQLGLQIEKIVISSAKSQWGSCIKSKRRISIQWRLALAPLGVIDYVIAHEVVHLRHSGHGKDFWQGVEAICPDYRERRRWLKENAHRLYWR